MGEVLVEPLYGKELISGQCREHWMKVLMPTIRKGKWSDEEDKNLNEVMASTSVQSWNDVSDLCLGRTAKQVTA